MLVAFLRTGLLGLLAEDSQTGVVGRGTNTGVREEGVERVHNELRARGAHPKGHVGLRLVNLLVLQDAIRRGHCG